LSDPYLDPESGVLRNRYAIINPQVLTRLERSWTRQRQRERLLELPMTPRGFCMVHKHLMGDLYSWAGEPRKMNMYLAGHRGQVLARFEPEDRIRPSLQRVFSELKADHYLVGSEVDRFAGKAAHYIAELNRIHAFREGNGRTMRFWLRELAQQAGHKLDLARLDRDKWLGASIAAHTASRDYRPMTALLKSAIVGREQDRAAPVPAGAVSIDDARLAVLRHLRRAQEQAAGRLTTLNAVRAIASSAELKADQRRAVKVAAWVNSREDGPMQRLEILRAAGVRTISVAFMDGKTDLERVLEIGKAARQTLRSLSAEELSRAFEIVLGRDRGGRDGEH
jgi:cell filamentation protein